MPLNVYGGLVFEYTQLQFEDRLYLTYTLLFYVSQLTALARLTNRMSTLDVSGRRADRRRTKERGEGDRLPHPLSPLDAAHPSVRPRALRALRVRKAAALITNEFIWFLKIPRRQSEFFLKHS